MEQRKSNTKVAGVDVGKRWLDAAVHGCEEPLHVANTGPGIGELVAWLKSARSAGSAWRRRAAMSAACAAALEAAGFEVVVHQPIEVRLFARLKRRRAKTDALDAVLIAAATAQVDTVKAAQDPRLNRLAERLTAYEQITSQAAEMKTFLEQRHG